MKIAFRILALVLAALAPAAAAPRRDGAVIRNTGSTNTAAYTVKVWSDGSAWGVVSNRAGTASSAPVTARLPMDIVKKFFADARANKAEGRITRGGCMKSASFGTSTYVLYHGWKSGDLQCPGGGTLASETAQIAAALHLPRASGVRRIPLLRNEPRRTESTPASPQAQASPSPGFHRSAS